MSLVENNHVIQTIPTNRSYNAFGIRVLPWRSRRSDNLLDTQALDPSLGSLTIYGIPVAQQESRSGIEWKCFYQLLGRPPYGGMRCNIEMHDVTAVMAEHEKHIENAKCGGRNRKEVNPRNTVGMIFEKRPPGLRRRFLLTNQILGNCRLRDIDTQLKQLSMNSGSAPAYVGCLHFPDELA